MNTPYEEFEKAKKLLNIDDIATFIQIKQKYHKEIQKYHPDKNKMDNNAHLKTVELMKAYETITIYCQNYLFDLSEKKFKSLNLGDITYDQASEKYHNWWKENYGKENLF